MTSLTISIAVHNLCEVTKNCIESIFRHTAKSEFELVVTDNASTDGTEDYLDSLISRYRNVRFSRNDRNLGFSKPHNDAFKNSTSEFFLVLNNDLTLCPGWLDTMMAEFEKDASLAACGIKNTCIALDEKGIGMPGEEAEYVEGSCLMVRSSFIKSLEGGLFDPAYKFAYYEDSDLGLRLRHAGLRIVVVDLPIIHVGAATANTVKNVDLEGYRVRNQHVFLSRWGKYLKERRRKPISTDRIVIRRAGAQGDVILVTPIIRALRRDFPKSTIVMETVCKDVLLGNPDVNEVIMAAAARDVDWVIDLNMAYEKQPGRHIVEVYAEAARVQLVSDDEWRPRLYPTDTARIVAAQRLPAGSRYALIHPGAIQGWVGRQWDWKRWVPVVNDLHKRGYKTVLVGNDATPQVATTYDLRNLHFSHFAAVMERANIFLGLDSMPFHVAQAFSIPSVVLFGSVDPELRIVRGAPVVPVTSCKVGCLGCHHWLPAPRTVTNSCLRGREMCMDDIDPGQVIESVTELEKKLIVSGNRF